MANICRTTAFAILGAAFAVIGFEQQGHAQTMSPYLLTLPPPRLPRLAQAPPPDEALAVLKATAEAAERDAKLAAEEAARAERALEEQRRLTEERRNETSRMVEDLRRRMQSEVRATAERAAKESEERLRSAEAELRAAERTKLLADIKEAMTEALRKQAEAEREEAAAAAAAQKREKEEADKEGAAQQAAKAAFEKSLFSACNRLLLYEPAQSADNEARLFKSNVDSALEAWRTLDPKSARPAAREATSWPFWLVGECADAMNAKVTGHPVETTTAVRLALVQQHLSYKKLERWFRKLRLGTPPTQPTATDGNGGSQAPLSRPAAPAASQTSVSKDEVEGLHLLRDLDYNVHTQMKSRDLLRPFSAALVSGPILSDATQVPIPSAANPGATVGANGQARAEENEDNKPAALSYVVWDSLHWGEDRGTWWDFSFGGRFGMQPIFALGEAQATATNATPATPTQGSAPASSSSNRLAAQHEQALIWTIGPSFNFHLPIQSAELPVYFRVGGTRLLRDVLLVERGTGSYIAVPADNDTGRTAWSWELGTEFNLFDDPLEILHSTKGLVSPKFHAKLALKRDARFTKAGNLATFNLPEWRIVFGFMLDAIKLIDQRPLGDPGGSFDFGFGVEYERAPWWAKGATIPATTRILIRGNVDLLKALTGQSPSSGTAQGSNSSATANGNASPSNGSQR